MQAMLACGQTRSTTLASDDRSGACPGRNRARCTQTLRRNARHYPIGDQFVALGQNRTVWRIRAAAPLEALPPCCAVSAIGASGPVGSTPARNARAAGELG